MKAPPATLQEALSRSATQPLSGSSRSVRSAAAALIALVFPPKRIRSLLFYRHNCPYALPADDKFPMLLRTPFPPRHSVGYSNAERPDCSRSVPQPARMLRDTALPVVAEASIPPRTQLPHRHSVGYSNVEWPDCSTSLPHPARMLRDAALPVVAGSTMPPRTQLPLPHSVG